MLTVVQIRALKPAAKPYRVPDAKGLFLLVQPSGALLWRYRFKFHGLDRKIAFGEFPEVSLTEARAKRDEARASLIDGIDPAAERRKKKLAVRAAAHTTFRLVADEYIAKMEREGRKSPTLSKARWFCDLLDSAIGNRPISDITPHELLAALRKIERRGHHETAQRLRAFAGRVFRYGFATLRTEHNPADILRGALTIPRVRHHAAILEPRGIGQLLRAIDDYTGRTETRIALKLAPHLFVRPGELRQACWSEIDLKAAVWRIPGERMKMGIPHVVPLSSQALSLLRELQALRRESEYLFPALGKSTRPMCENTLNQALRRLGYGSREMTSHGFRAIASTLLNESGLWHPDAIERALAHRDRDPVRAAYHRGAHWEERVRMAQWWSDHLDELRSQGVVLHRRFGQAGAAG
ncbi:tyrosine-type recombinase/integrase [Sphingomonas sp. AP4-R1]|uniref:tyrosine-type recombinase/integrase n=1 Tax=Sphingomonas sp. AP4-R1 TaxID=2735134 RepID=UPI001493A44A|nr:tyrosine-type recombinase/integrase [Sphingomonas sp. AP4-R1]QJU57003.1 tyrosine-type recombinase/integrase [Sphingomonas sp. AP4-R1]